MPTPPAALPMPKPRKLGNYELLDRIAVGGMAEIYRARSVGVQGFEKAYVLKLIHPKYVGDRDFIQMLVDEAKLTARLVHHNIAQVTDLGIAQDQYYVAMEYVEGKDLSQVITATWSRGEPLPTDIALYVAEQMCAGLHYAHNKTDADGRPINLVHRDISPQNVLLSFHGEVKIIDFGVAKAALGARPETRAGIIKGKFRYMSPEQSWGDTLDGRSDLFSVGLCLYEMLTGTSAYTDGGNMHQLLLAMREAKITPVHELRPDIDPALSALVQRALARHRHERFADGREFQVALADHLHRRYPGFTPHRISELHRRLFPEAAAALGAGSTAAAGDGLGAEEITDATVQQRAPWADGADVPTEETETGQGGEEQRVSAAGPALLDEPTLRREAELTDEPTSPLREDDFADEVTALFNHDRHELPGDATSAMDRDRIGSLLRETAEGPGGPGPASSAEHPSLRQSWQREESVQSGHLRPETGTRGDVRRTRAPAPGTAQMTPLGPGPGERRGQRDPSLSERAMELRRRASEALQTEQGRKVLLPVVGVAIALVVLLIVGLIVF